MKRHKCWSTVNGRQWLTCTACNGRVHLPGCTSKRDKRKDCCKARHRMLYEQGQIKGICDSSVAMMDDFELLDD